LADGADLAGTAELVASELASNVVRAATSGDGRPWYGPDGSLPVLWVRLLAGPNPAPSREQALEPNTMPRDRAATRAVPLRAAPARAVPACVQIEVWDDLPPERGIPQPRAAADTDESGRGLAIIAELSHSCGWSPVLSQVPGRTAKRVWARLSA
jgi:hypothetical protein